MELIFYAFVLYALHVILPLLPAVLIYQMFPDTKVGLTGPLEQLTVKAGGAFAAYVITVLLGTFLVADTMEMIKMRYRGHFMSEVELTVHLRDADGKELPEGAIGIANPSISLNPPPYQVREDSIKVKVPGEPSEYTFRIEVPGFGEARVCPEERGIEEKGARQFVLAEVVEVRQNAASYETE